jgi:hypothetical protein
MMAGQEALVESNQFGADPAAVVVPAPKDCQNGVGVGIHHGALNCCGTGTWLAVFRSAVLPGTVS